MMVNGKNEVIRGRYQILRILGQGGFGTTYYAMDLIQNIPVAIKEYDMRQSGIGELRREMAILQRFGNIPGIVTVYDCFSEENRMFLVMEYVEGISLKQLMEERGGFPFSEWEVFQMLRPVMDALMEIHEGHILHRDVSPDNIILRPDGVTTLIDFGSARVNPEVSDRSMTVCLKHGYAPIEQYQTHGHQGEWTDVYGISATMYYLMSGIRPMPSVDRVDADRLLSLWDLSQQNPNIQVSQPMSEMIQRGMALHPNGRYHSVHSLARDMEIYFSGGGQRGGNNGSGKRRKSSPVSPLLAALLALILLGTAAMCGYLLYSKVMDKKDGSHITGEELQEKKDKIEELNGENFSYPLVKVFASNYQPAERDYSLWWNSESYLAWRNGKSGECRSEKRRVVNKAPGNQMDDTIWYDNADGHVVRIVTIEYLEDGQLQMTEYYYDSDEKISCIFTRTRDQYYEETDPTQAEGYQYYFSGDVMVRWRVIENGTMTDYTLGSAEHVNADAPIVADYDTLEDALREAYDIKEEQRINSAYNTLNTLRDAQAIITVKGQAVDEMESPEADIEISLKISGENGVVYTFRTDEDGAYELHLPMEEEKYILEAEDGRRFGDISVVTDTNDLEIQAEQIVLQEK